MSLKLGTTDINKLMLGSTEINKAYLGSTIVYEKTAGAAVSYIAHYRDSAGSQLPTTSWAAMNFATEVSNDVGSNVTSPSANTFQIGEALPSGKAKIFIANVKWDSSANNRANPQGRFVLSSGTGNLFTTYHSGYIRNNANRTAWVRVIGILTDCSEDAQIQLEVRTDKNLITGTGSIANASDFQVGDLYYTAIAMYTDTTGGQSLNSLATRTTVNLNNTVQESDTAAIERSGNTVTIKGDNKKYLLLGSVAGSGGGTRTQRVANFNYAGSSALDTMSYAYQRSTTNEFGGMILADLYETATTDISVEMEGFRGNRATLTGGDADAAEQAGSWTTNSGQVGMCVIELPDTAEGFKSTDATGLQTIAGGSTTTINAMRATTFNDANSYTRASNTVMNVENDHNMICWGNMFTGRTSTSGTRGTFGCRVTINGVDQTVGESGNFTRGDQSTSGTFGGSFSAGAIFSVSNDDDIGIETFDAGDNGSGDRTQAGAVGFFALNLDSTAPAYV